MFKILSIKRDLGQDTTKFVFLKKQITMTARPIKLWKYFYWGTDNFGSSHVFQCPWITLSVKK